MKIQLPIFNKKRQKKSDTPLVCIVLNAVDEDLENKNNHYTIFIHQKLNTDPFIKTMMGKIQKYIEDNYEL